MNMFCYQCQEAAKCTGCTVRGICGKTSDVSNLQDLLIYVLKGISIYSTELKKPVFKLRKQTTSWLMACFLLLQMSTRQGILH